MSAGFLRPALAGAAATCAGNGLARFAYVPIFPAMVGAGWVDGGQAGLLGAAALGGYLMGTLGGRAAARRIGVPATLDLGMALVVLAMAACAWNGGFAWLMAWRTMAGVAGGLLMALAGPATQASVPMARRGAAGGVVIAGVGIGIVTGALLVPALLPAGLPATWLGLAGVVALLWLAVRRHWPDMEMRGVAAQAPPRAGMLLLTYGLHSAGMVPPMVYLADLAARGRGLGVTAGAMAWLLFGLGGIVGGLASGRLTDRIGGRRTLQWWLGIQGVALALALVPSGAAVPGLGGDRGLRGDRRDNGDADGVPRSGASTVGGAMGAMHGDLRGGADGRGLRGGAAVRGHRREPRGGFRGGFGGIAGGDRGRLRAGPFSPRQNVTG